MRKTFLVVIVLSGLVMVSGVVVYHFALGLPWVDSFYFVVTTMTTVGYGDISPVHPVARTLAMSEALVGQLFPAILIGRLVSMELVSRRERAEGGRHG